MFTRGQSIDTGSPDHVINSQQTSFPSEAPSRINNAQGRREVTAQKLADWGFSRGFPQQLSESCSQLKTLPKATGSLEREPGAALGSRKGVSVPGNAGVVAGLEFRHDHCQLLSLGQDAWLLWSTLGENQ